MRDQHAAYQARLAIQANWAGTPGRWPRPPFHVIGLTGYARSGKDTVAAHLVARYGFYRLAFADVLKAAALDLDPIVKVEPTFDVAGWSSRVVRLRALVEAVGWEDAKAVPEVRRTLQALGVAMRDNVSERVWIDAAFAGAQYAERPIVVTDVRFPNEVEAIRDRGGIIVRVDRPGLKSDGHVSESLQVLPDVQINNHGSLAQLAAQIDNTLGVMLP